MPQMTFDLLDGEPPVSFVLSTKDAERFGRFMGECQASMSEADRLRAEVEALRAASVIEWEPGRSYTAAELLRRAMWVAVPVKPPDDLLRDIAQAIQYPAVYAERAHPAAMNAARRVYRAMLSARPEFPKESDHE